MSANSRPANCWDCGRTAVWHVIRPRRDHTGPTAKVSCSRHLNLTCWSLHVSRADAPFHTPVAAPFQREDPATHTGANEHQPTGVHDQYGGDRASRYLDVSEIVPKAVSPGVRRNVPKASGPGAPA
jgi:hypothetical protein